MWFLIVGVEGVIIVYKCDGKPDDVTATPNPERAPNSCGIRRERETLHRLANKMMLCNNSKYTNELEPRMTSSYDFTMYSLIFL